MALVGDTICQEDCRVPKLFRRDISPCESMVKLTNKKIRWMVDQVIKKGESTDVVAQVQGVSRRRVQQVVKFYKEHGRFPVLDMKRRPCTYLTKEQKI